jgi:hypothetical protein
LSPHPLRYLLNLRADIIRIKSPSSTFAVAVLGTQPQAMLGPGHFSWRTVRIMTQTSDRCKREPASAIDEGVRNSPKARTRTAPSVRRSVTIPAQLAIEVERVAKRKRRTMSRALVMLAQRGVNAEAAARASLNATYRRFLPEGDLVRKNEAGKDLMRAIFGKDAIAEDSIL